MENNKTNTPIKTISRGQYIARIIIIIVVTIIILAAIFFFLAIGSMAHAMSNGASNFSVFKLVMYYILVLAVSFALLNATCKKYKPQPTEMSLSRTNSIIIILILGLLAVLAYIVFATTRSMI